MRSDPSHQTPNSRSQINKKTTRPPTKKKNRTRRSRHSSISASLSLPSLATSPTTSPSSPFAASTSDETISRREMSASISARWACTSAKRRSFSACVFCSLAFRLDVAAVMGRERWAWRTVCGGRRSGLDGVSDMGFRRERKGMRGLRTGLVGRRGRLRAGGRLRR